MFNGLHHGGAALLNADRVKKVFVRHNQRETNETSYPRHDKASPWGVNYRVSPVKCKGADSIRGYGFKARTLSCVCDSFHQVIIVK